ncbi:MAG TPA: type II toxin-antitoxin system VapC family toxin [Thermodesulfobacteriota bacterium]|nr:type II toxin-antitoxin system VapC family toxin [Thermodesulfobacteriota bacterium]
MNTVLDASVLAKFYVPEILSDRAEALLADAARRQVDLNAPDLIYPEIGNVLWKKLRRGELTGSDIGEIVQSVCLLPLRIVPSKALLPLAVDIGARYGITVYDSIYVSAAQVSRGELITADRRLADTLAKTDLGKMVSWLGDYGN